MVPRSSLRKHFAVPPPSLNRERFEAHNQRAASRARAQSDLLSARKKAVLATPP